MVETLLGGSIEVGAALFTLVEPHRGHEVEYNRWYERDHFYAGCMIGPWIFSGRRWVCTSDLKELRYGSEIDRFGGADLGTYLATYWFLKERLAESFGWSSAQVRWLHANDRMFEHRDHIHTFLYRYGFGVGADGVGPQLALDHPYASLCASFYELPHDMPWRSLQPLLAAGRPENSLVFKAIPMTPEAPKLDQSDAGTSSAEVVLVMAFSRSEPHVHCEANRAQEAELIARGVNPLWVSPFKPTIPGTDIYTDQLWGDK